VTEEKHPPRSLAADIGLWLVVILSVPAIIVALFLVNGFFLRP
jgi:hypothetical protein